MNLVVGDVPNCVAYLDDLVVHSNTWTDHVSSLRVVFERLAKASLTLNLAKCEFRKATVTYLGKEVGRGQVRTLSSRVDAIASFPPPSTRRELRRFLGMAGYYEFLPKLLNCRCSLDQSAQPLCFIPLIS